MKQIEVRLLFFLITYLSLIIHPYSAGSQPLEPSVFSTGDLSNPQDFPLLERQGFRVGIPQEWCDSFFTATGYPQVSCLDGQQNSIPKENLKQGHELAHFQMRSVSHKLAKTFLFIDQAGKLDFLDAIPDSHPAYDLTVGQCDTPFEVSFSEKSGPQDMTCAPDGNCENALKLYYEIAPFLQPVTCPSECPMLTQLGTCDELRCKRKILSKDCQPILGHTLHINECILSLIYQCSSIPLTMQNELVSRHQQLE